VSVQASQQLGWFPTQALPPAGGWSVQDEELLLVLHFVVPLELVRQQVTKPGFPQVERAAHFLTAPLHPFGSDVFWFTWCATHETYRPWLVAVVQPVPAASHAWSAAARAASTCALVVGSLRSQPALANRTVPKRRPRARRPRTRYLIFGTSFLQPPV